MLNFSTISSSFLKPFFAVFDQIVIRNLESGFVEKITIPEAKMFYRFQEMMEDIHVQTYSLFPEMFVGDEERKDYLLKFIRELSMTYRINEQIEFEAGIFPAVFGAETFINKDNLHAEIGQIVAGMKPGRERDDETILFWHRGLSLSDIALGGAMLAKAKALGIGQQLFYAHFEPGGNH